jgi:hypothetical protein
MGVSGQRHAPAALSPGDRNPGTHCTGGWVGPRAGLDTEVREKSFAPAGDRTPIARSSSKVRTSQKTQLVTVATSSWLGIEQLFTVRIIRNPKTASAGKNKSY